MKYEGMQYAMRNYEGFISSTRRVYPNMNKLGIYSIYCRLGDIISNIIYDRE